MLEHWRTKNILAVASSRLARKFAAYTIGLSIIIAFTISLIWVYSSYYRILEDLNEELTQVEDSIKNSLVFQLWQMNLDGINIIIDDLLVDKDIVYVKLVDDKGNVLIEKGNIPPRHTLYRSIPLYYHPAKGKSIYLGKLIYVATTEAFFKNFKHYFLKTLISLLFFFLSVGIAIQLIYWHTTVKHLLAIKEYANKIRLGGYKEEIGELNLYRYRPTGSKDELEELVDSINEMYHEIVDKFATIEYQSLHDALTGLPNRRMINKLISYALADCQENSGYRALLSVDLDNFKLLNESLGHATGDEILREVANLLVDIGGKEFRPARVSGDQFLILQNDSVPDCSQARKIAESFSKQLLAAISQHIVIGGRDIKLTACIGVSLLGPDSKPDVVLKQVDIALHHAKSMGQGQMAFFDPAMQRMTDRRLQLGNLINRAIDRDLLYVDYQPKFCGPGRICSAEALARLRDGEGGIIPPSEFIPVLEQTGAIVEIGDHIIKMVFEFIGKHRSEFESSKLNSIAVNVSPVQFNSAGFADRMISLAKQYNVSPKFIIFEITEDIVVGNIENVVDVMQKLTASGFRFSIDDFGTGYSSLRYLKNLPLAELKIDHSLVKDVITDNRARAIVITIIDIAHNFHLDVVAEGVESKEQFEYLEQYGCDQYQGFFFSPPLSAKDFLAILQTNNSEHGV